MKPLLWACLAQQCGDVCCHGNGGMEPEAGCKHLKRCGQQRPPSICPCSILGWAEARPEEQACDPAWGQLGGAHLQSAATLESKGCLPPPAGGVSQPGGS